MPWLLLRQGFGGPHWGVVIVKIVLKIVREINRNYIKD